MEQIKMDIIDYKIKPLIQSLSLTCHKTICPYCGMDNPNADDYPDTTRRRRDYKVYPHYSLPMDYCPNCGKKFDTEKLETKMSKDYAECERLGLKGAVYKDEKGKWRESVCK